MIEWQNEPFDSLISSDYGLRIQPDMLHGFNKDNWRWDLLGLHGPEILIMGYSSRLGRYLWIGNYPTLEEAKEAAENTPYWMPVKNAAHCIKSRRGFRYCWQRRDGWQIAALDARNHIYGTADSRGRIWEVTYDAEVSLFNNCQAALTYIEEQSKCNKR